MRTWMPVTVLSFRLARRKDDSLKGTLLSPLASPVATAGAGTIAATELIADKLPILPNRIRPDVWIGRTVTGAITGGAWARASNERVATGAIVGGVAAAVATYALYHLRRAASRHVPDVVPAVAEDLIAVAIGISLLSTSGASSVSRSSSSEG
jgi:uncharacterized membrane protein